jgi:hypothetical protein
MCVLILLYMFPHTTIFVSLILVYVSSYYYMSVLIVVYVSSYYYVSAYYYICVLMLLCVLILLHMCPHTTMSSYYYTCEFIVCVFFSDGGEELEDVQMPGGVSVCCVVCAYS